MAALANKLRCGVCVKVDMRLDIVRPAELLKKSHLFYYCKLQNITLVLNNLDGCCQLVTDVAQRLNHHTFSTGIG
jgi:hypothetical protein